MGAWPNPPVASQSEVYGLLAGWGLPTSTHYRVAPTAAAAAEFIEYFVTEGRISQLHSQAMARLKTLLSDDEYDLTVE